MLAAAGRRTGEVLARAAAGRRTGGAVPPDSSSSELSSIRACRGDRSFCWMRTTLPGITPARGGGGADRGGDGDGGGHEGWRPRKRGVGGWCSCCCAGIARAPTEKRAAAAQTREEPSFPALPRSRRAFHDGKFLTPWIVLSSASRTVFRLPINQSISAKRLSQISNGSGSSFRYVGGRNRKERKRR